MSWKRGVKAGKSDAAWGREGVSKGGARLVAWREAWEHGRDAAAAQAAGSWAVRSRARPAGQLEGS